MATYQDTTENLPKLKYGDTIVDSLGKQLGTVKYDYKTGKPLAPTTPKMTPDSPLSRLSTLGMEPQQNDSYQQLLEKQSRGEDIVNTGQIRSDIMSQFQDRINAINSIYNQQLEKARQEGVGRIGSGTSILAARGLTGSMRGGAIKEGILDQNRQIEGAINAERNAKIQEVYGLASQMAVEEAARRREAMMSGAKNYIDYIKSQGETRKSNLSNVAMQMFVQGIDPTSISQEELSSLANKIGVSTNDIIGTYKQVQYENKATDKKGFELSEGQARYEFDPETGTYKQIAAMGKTYKPGSGGGSTLTPYQQFQATQSIAKDTEKRTQNAREMSRQSQLIKDSYANIVGGGDRSLNTQAIITAFNKILDPTSVVRESEYDRTAQGQSLLAQLQGKIQNIAKGGAGVTEATLKEAVDIADKYLAGAQQSINAQNQRARQIAEQFGLNPDFVTSGGMGAPSASDDELLGQYGL